MYKYLFSISLLLGCQVGADDNMSSFTPGPDYMAPTLTHIEGSWRSQDNEFVIETGKIKCSGAEETITVYQKHVELDRPACSVGYTALYQLPPPYDALRIQDSFGISSYYRN